MPVYNKRGILLLPKVIVLNPKDGCGFDNKKVSRSSSGLGLRLISSLVQSSLKGELFIETGESGTGVRFSFLTPEQ